MPKHIAPQFELPGVETAFNLAGETIRQPEAKPAAKPDLTPEMFADTVEIKRENAADLRD